MKIKPDLMTNRVGEGPNSCDSQNKLNGLDELLTKYKEQASGNVLEIGSYKGVSTSLLAYYANSVTSVDIATTNELKAVAETYGNIKIVVGQSSEVTWQFEDESFDLIYIDAAHEYEFVKKDIEACLSKLKKNGIVSGHDYRDNHQGVMTAVNEFVTNGIIKNLCVFSDFSWAASLACSS